MPRRTMRLPLSLVFRQPGTRSARPRGSAALIAWFAAACLAGPVSAQSLRVVAKDDVITVTQDGRAVVTYNKQSPPVAAGIDPVYERSGFLHPVHSPRGRTLTGIFPVDHPHQHGIFSAWVETSYDGKPVDFWNLAGRGGRVLHSQVVSTSQNGKTAAFEVDLVHRALTTPPVDVLRERWKITVHPTDGTYYCFDLTTTQTAITDKPLIVQKYHYGGIALRGRTQWLTDRDTYVRQHPNLPREPSGFLNDRGSGRAKGNHEHAKWVALWGKTDGQPVTIAVLCHADSFRAPQAARLHPTKPYFCFAPCVDGSFTIDRDHPFHARYRYLITDAKPDPQWLDDQWTAWCGPDGPGGG